MNYLIAKGEHDFLLRNIGTGIDWYLTESDLKLLRKDIDAVLAMPPVDSDGKEVLQ